MSCQNIQDRIPNFLKSEMNPSEETEMVDHLNACVECRKAYQEIRQKMQEASNP